MLPFRNHPRCLFLSLLCLLPYGRSSANGPISNSRTWPCATKSNVLCRSTKKRPKLSSGDRFFWVHLYRIWRDLVRRLRRENPI